jgi:hypothetical protein
MFLISVASNNYLSRFHTKLLADARVMLILCTLIQILRRMILGGRQCVAWKKCVSVTALKQFICIVLLMISMQVKTYGDGNQ